MRSTIGKALLGALGSLTAAAPAFAGAGEVDAKLSGARERFVRMQLMAAEYEAKRNLAYQSHVLQAHRRETEATVRQLKVVIDSFPPRRSNLQEEVYQQWLMARSALTEIDRSLGELGAQMREIDQTMLAWAERSGLRPGPMNRFDILTAFPAACKECRDAFAELKVVAEAEARQSGAGVDQVLRNVNAALNAECAGDARFDPPAPFIAAFREFIQGKRSFAPPAGPSGNPRKGGKYHSRR
jgi:hypothetical protein